MKLILGSMTFADQVGQQTAKLMLESFAQTANREIDTAHTYADGGTETLLGKILPSTDTRNFQLATKLHPWNEQGLQAEQLKRQMATSLQRLGRDSVDLLYLHSPDLDTPIEQTLACCFELYRQGRFRDFGLSNYAAWQVAEVVELCRRHGWMQPRVYQGMYNALTRDVERELFACLRNYGICFYAYNPLAGGLLSGKHRNARDLPDDGRFAAERGYRERYWKPEYFAVLQELQQACATAGLQPAAVALRWLCHHSRLDAKLGDGIIIGASSIEHLQQNLEACEQAELTADIIEILDRGWEIIRPDCFKYFRP